MAAHSMDDRPPSYMSQDSQTSTLIDRADPPISAILKPGHSTRASRLSYATSQGRYTILEYYELTFPLMVWYNGMKEIIVVAVDEELEDLRKDIQRIFNPNMGTLNSRIQQLRVGWSAAGRSSCSETDLLREDNITAMLRFVKSRNGVDQVMAR